MSIGRNCDHVSVGTGEGTSGEQTCDRIWSNLIILRVLPIILVFLLLLLLLLPGLLLILLLFRPFLRIILAGLVLLILALLLLPSRRKIATKSSMQMTGSNSPSRRPRPDGKGSKPTVNKHNSQKPTAKD